MQIKRRFFAAMFAIKKVKMMNKVCFSSAPGLAFLRMNKAFLCSVSIDGRKIVHTCRQRIMEKILYY